MASRRKAGRAIPAKALAPRKVVRAPRAERERVPVEPVGSRRAGARVAPPATPAPSASVAEQPALRASFTLERQCTLREAEQLKAALQAAEDSSGDFIIDAGAVERIDTAGLQVLLAFVGRMRLTDRRLLWSRVSSAVIRNADQLGVRASLGLDAGTEATR